MILNSITQQQAIWWQATWWRFEILTCRLPTNFSGWLVEVQQRCKLTNQESSILEDILWWIIEKALKAEAYKSKVVHALPYIPPDDGTCSGTYFTMEVLGKDEGQATMRFLKIVEGAMHSVAREIESQSFWTLQFYEKDIPSWLYDALSAIDLPEVGELQVWYEDRNILGGKP